MEKLTAFLEENVSIECYECQCGILVKEHNSRIVNFVLDIVGEEVEKKAENSGTWSENRTGTDEDGYPIFYREVFISKDDIKQILTNLKK